MSNPILVNTLRGEVVENRHRGAVAVCDPRGRVAMALGDIQALVYPRSAVKALQAIPLVESGAADHFEVSDAELALACSSHNAQPRHTQAVGDWLARLNLNWRTLACGAHPPLHPQTAKAMIAAGEIPNRMHNNCSGKHAGLLTTTCFFGESTHDYIARNHPAQQRWFDALGEMAAVDMRRLPWCFDGCGIPVIAMPLASIARAFGCFAAPEALPKQRAEAVERIARAIAAHPFMVAGSERLCTDLMQVTGRRVMVKTGAAGVFAAALPGRGMGVALKIDDGSREAAEVALLACLRHLNVLRADDLKALAARFRVAVVNTRGQITGHCEPASVWEVHTTGAMADTTG